MRAATLAVAIVSVIIACAHVLYTKHASYPSLSSSSSFLPPSSVCTLDRVSSPSVSLFMERYYNKRPVVLMNISIHNTAPPSSPLASPDFPHSFSNSPFVSFTRVSRLLAHFASRRLTLNTANTYSHKMKSLSFVQYICDTILPMEMKEYSHSSTSPSPSSRSDHFARLLRHRLDTPANETYYFFGEHDDFPRLMPKQLAARRRTWRAAHDVRSPYHGDGHEKEKIEENWNDEEDFNIVANYCRLWQSQRALRLSRDPASSSSDLSDLLGALTRDNDPLNLLAKYGKTHDNTSKADSSMTAMPLSWASLLAYYRVAPHAFAVPWSDVPDDDREILGLSADGPADAPFVLPAHLNDFLSAHSHYDYRLSFGVAGRLTGVPFHFHGPTFAEVLHGQKLWFLYPPKAAVTSQAYKRKRFHYPPPELVAADQSAVEWLAHVYPRLTEGDPRYDKELAEELSDLRQCTLGPGELIYLPPDWYHMTFNTGHGYNAFISIFMADKPRAQLKEEIIEEEMEEWKEEIDWPSSE